MRDINSFDSIIQHAEDFVQRPSLNAVGFQMLMIATTLIVT